MSLAQRARLYERLGRGLSAGRSIGLVLREEKLDAVSARLESGATLEEATRADSARFPAPVPAILGAAEKSGALGDVLSELSRELDEQAKLEARFWRALVQPAVLIGLVLFLVPLVPAYLETSVHELEHGATAKGSLLLAYLHQVVPTLLWTTGALVGGALVLLVVPVTAIPLVGGLVEKLQHARIARLLSLSFDAGLSVPDAIRAAARATGSNTLIRNAEKAALAITRGGTLSTSLADARVFPKAVERDLAAGEASGTLVETFRRIDQEAREAFERRAKLLGRIGSIVASVLMAALVAYASYRFVSRQASEALKALEL